MNFAHVLKGLEVKEGDVIYDGSGFHWKKTARGIQALRDCAIYIPDCALVHIPAPAGLGKIVNKKVKKWLWAWRVYPQNEGGFVRDYLSESHMSEEYFLRALKKSNPNNEFKYWKLEGTEIEEEVEDYVHG